MTSAGRMSKPIASTTATLIELIHEAQDILLDGGSRKTPRYAGRCATPSDRDHIKRRGSRFRSNFPFAHGWLFVRPLPSTRSVVEVADNVPESVGSRRWYGM